MRRRGRKTASSEAAAQREGTFTEETEAAAQQEEAYAEGTEEAAQQGGSYAADAGGADLAGSEEDDLPSSDALKAELAREQYRRQYARTVRSTIYGLVAVAAVAVLIATLLLPILRIYGSSMTPTLEEGQIVVSIKGSDFEQGDIIAFYYEGKILIKRVIATAGSWVDIDDEGNVYVDGVLLSEPYITEKALGECDIELPYQVPDDRIFVMGDHRATSVDSRSSTIGCIAEEEIVGRIVFRIWPLEDFGVIE